MNDLPITYAGFDYLDRTRPLLDGTVKPAGVSLRYICGGRELFSRLIQHTEFDAAEMSFSIYANLISRGDHRYIAIPFFPSRYFRQSQRPHRSVLQVASFSDDWALTEGERE